MGQKLHNRIEIWKKLLLDFGKRNRLINFLEGKRNNVKILSPSYNKFYELIVVNEREVVFPYARKVQIDDEGKETYEAIIKGDIEVKKPIDDLQKTLKSLRYKANTSIEEQGINTLYLTFGMLKWKEQDNSSQTYTSPVILVPVRLHIESLTSPYRLTLHDDEIVINPTLSHKLKNDFGLIMPDFNVFHDSPEEYLDKLARKVEVKGWNVERSTHLTNLSFLKINMYKDLERNEEKLNLNSIIAALVGEQDPVKVSEEFNNFDHDSQIRPIETFQVVDADSSQQDAVLLSKKGVSFVLQGPPGTGKSQTITNIIAEAIAEGKKVLFVSEKMAALQVVYNRLASVGLADFCFTLHSHKAKKKEILRDLNNSISINRTRVKEEALAQLDILERKRNALNQYQAELHTQTSGLNISIYSVNGKLAKLENTPDVIFAIESVEKTTELELTDRIYLLQEFAKTVEKRSEDYSNNAWRNSSVRLLTNELRHDINSNVQNLVQTFTKIAKIFDECYNILGIKIQPSFKGLETLLELLAFVSKSTLIPTKWIYDDSIRILRKEAVEYQQKTVLIIKQKKQLLSLYSDEIFEMNGKKTLEHLEKCIDIFKTSLKADSNNKLIANIDSIISEAGISLNILSNIFSKAISISQVLGFDTHLSLNKLKALYEITLLLQKDICPTIQWFDDKKFIKLRTNLTNDRKIHEAVTAIKAELEELYREEIIDYDCKEIQQRFNTKYMPYARHFSKEKINFSDVVALPALEDLSIRLKSVNNKISSVCDTVVRICNILNIETPTTFTAINETICFAELISKGIVPTEEWFNQTQYSAIKSSLDNVIKEHNIVAKLKERIIQIFDSEILSVDLYPMLQRFRSNYGSTIKRIFSSEYKRDLTELKRYMHNGGNLSYAKCLQYLSLLKEYIDGINVMNSKEYASDFGIYYSGIETNWAKVIDALTIFDKAKKYKKLVTSKLKNTWTRGEIDYDLLSNEIILYNKINLSEDFADINQFLFNKISEFSKLSDIKDEIEALHNEINAFIVNIRKDCSSIDAFSKNECEKSIAEYCGILDKICELQRKLKEINTDEDIYNKYSSRYGAYYYKGIDTNWNSIEDAFDIFNEILKKFNHIPAILQNKLVEHSLPLSLLKDFTIEYKKYDYDSIYSTIQQYFSFDVNVYTNYDYIKETYNELKEHNKLFNKTYNQIVSLRKVAGDFDTIYAEVKSLADIQIGENELSECKEYILSKYENYYNEINTDWERLFTALEFADNFKVLIDIYTLPRSFVEAICTQKETIDYCYDKNIELSKLKSEVEEPYKWFISLFQESETFNSYILKDFIARLNDCANKMYLLEEWVDYCSNREKCQKAGLEVYLNQIENNRIDEKHIVNAYLKRFYRLWLDATLPNFPAVHNFRRRTQTQTISEFCELDKAQFKIAQARIRERALSRIPDFNSINAARDEIAILKRELNKQRRIMPLRKLFMAIPNLITSLRPCFMMSPLSVSVFLEAQSYNFDMVIFDEASQVHTEDAIGAIMRGKQVIIVGDTKQLPPTSFFSASVNDEDFDIDSDEPVDDNDGAYESILDEAVTFLPERSLRWHYRSRHEHLIAFSNIKIYNNQLITFPSSTETALDCGVEYVYVKDGIYDRGGKKNNVREAQKVADLVFEHFNKYSKRSLGVVTFSEAQQNAVDAAIRQKRLQSPHFDRFFIEDKEEPFFIKNLENVQGDERDTIIFSIGYAKDSNNTMHMNFGPLSREGGYRRLNVAITRAKHNVKLVGSIAPTDIDLDKVTSEGVKMLRSYIEFAQHGISALEKELTFNYNLEFDSPFEEAVYDFLQLRGYNVVT